MWASSFFRVLNVFVTKANLKKVFFIFRKEKENVNKPFAASTVLQKTISAFDGWVLVIRNQMWILGILILKVFTIIFPVQKLLYIPRRKHHFLFMWSLSLFFFELIKHLLTFLCLHQQTFFTSLIPQTTDKFTFFSLYGLTAKCKEGNLLTKKLFYVPLYCLHLLFPIRYWWVFSQLTADKTISGATGCHIVY